MAKVKYKGITFDSDLEVDYYKYLLDLKNKLIVDFIIYHPQVPIYLNQKNKYTPDFIVCYPDKIEIIETKGYNQFSYMRDNIIHNEMLAKTEDQLRSYVVENLPGFDLEDRKIVYRKIKYLKAFGFVEWDFKNPNTAINKAREKRKELEGEIKELKSFKKDAIRCFSYQEKVKDGYKLSRSQEEWMKNFLRGLSNG